MHVDFDILNAAVAEFDALWVSERIYWLMRAAKDSGGDFSPEDLQVDRATTHISVGAFGVYVVGQGAEAVSAQWRFAAQRMLEILEETRTAETVLLHHHQTVSDAQLEAACEQVALFSNKTDLRNRAQELLKAMRQMAAA